MAEVRKRGKDFWAEFEFYLSDLFVGLVLDVALVSLMAPAAVLGGVSRAAMSSGWLAKALAKVPSAFFEANILVRGGWQSIYKTLAHCSANVARGPQECNPPKAWPMLQLAPAECIH